MPPAYSRPVLVIAPGGSLSPAHYGLLMHLLMEAGYAVVSSTLPSTGSNSQITVEEDQKFIRQRLVLPVLDIEEHDVIVISHSYSGLPASAAVAGLSKEDRLKCGKKTSVLGQIFLAAVMAKGGEGKSMIDTFGGQAPPHVQIDEAANLVRCEDAGPPLFHDVKPQPALAAAVASCMCPSLTAWTSPIPRASWDESGYQRRCAYIKTTDDRGVPLAVQEMVLQSTGVEMTVREIASSHCPQLAQPEQLSQMIVELAQQFEKVV